MDQDVVFKVHVDASQGLAEASKFDQSFAATGTHVQSLEEGANQFLAQIVQMLHDTAPALQQFHTDIEQVVQGFAEASQGATKLGQDAANIKAPQGLFGKLEAEIEQLKVAQKEAFTLDEAKGYQEKINAAEHELSRLQGELTKTEHEGTSAFGKLKEKVSEFGEKFREGFKEGAGMGVAILGLNNLGGAVESAFDKFEQQEDAERGLKIALGDIGDGANAAFEDLKHFASARQEVTTFGDEGTLKLLQFGKQFANISDPARLKQFAVAVQNFSAATGKGLEESSQKIAAVLEGGGKLRELKAVQFNTGDIQGNLDKFIATTEKKFGGFAEKIAEGPTGAIKQFKNDFGDTLEQVGGVAAQLLQPILTPLGTVVRGFTSFLAVINEAPGPLRLIVGAIAAIVGGLTAYNVISNLSVVSTTRQLVTEGALNAARTLGLVTLNAENEVTGAGVVITGAIDVAKGLLNGTLIKSAALWLVEKAQILGSTVVSAAHETVTGALLVAKNLLNGSLIKSAAVWVAETAVKIASTAATVAMTIATVALTVAMTVLTSPITYVVLVIAALVAGIIYAYKHSETFRNILGALWNVIKTVGEFMFKWLTPIGLAIQGFKLLYEKVAFFRQAVDATVGAVKSSWSWLSKLVGASNDASEAESENASATDKAADAQEKLHDAVQQTIASYKGQQQSLKDNVQYLTDQNAAIQQNIRDNQEYAKHATDPKLKQQALDNIALGKQYLENTKKVGQERAKEERTMERQNAIAAQAINYVEDYLAKAQSSAAIGQAELETSLRKANNHKLSLVAQQQLNDEQIKGLQSIKHGAEIELGKAFEIGKIRQLKQQIADSDRQIEQLLEKHDAQLKAIRDKYLEITEGIDNAVIAILKLLAEQSGNKKTVLDVLQEEIDLAQAKVAEMVGAFAKAPNTSGVLSAINGIVDATGKIRPDIDLASALLQIKKLSDETNATVTDDFVKTQKAINADFVDPRKVLDAINGLLTAQKGLRDAEDGFSAEDAARLKADADLFDQFVQHRLDALQNQNLTEQQLQRASADAIQKEFDAAMQRAGDNTELQLALISKFQDQMGKVLEAGAKIQVTAAENLAKGIADKVQSVLDAGFSNAWSILNDRLFGPWKEEINKTKNLFESMVEGMAEQITKLAEEILAKAAIFAILSAIVPGSGAVAGGFLNFIGFADGGRVTTPTFAVVGEKWQPELILPELKVDDILEKKITRAQQAAPSLSQSDMAAAFGQALRENPTRSTTRAYDLLEVTGRETAKYNSRR